MTQSDWTVSVFAMGSLVLFLAGWLCVRLWRILRRGLASAIIGELVGVLRIIETGNVEQRLLHAACGRRSNIAPAMSLLAHLPPPVVFQANAGRLGLLAPSLARMLANFYALMAGISAGSRIARGAGKDAETLSRQLREALAEADDILRGLKPLL
jgi:hypothetical protein